MNKKNFAIKDILFGALVVGAVVVLSACDSEQPDKEPGQALVSVDGEEITILQLNDELSRAKVQADQIENAKKQLLESIIDRQLMLVEAQRDKLDRTPNVMQAIERSRKQIIAQAYLQNILSKVGNPSATEINEFYQEHPELFAQLRQYNLTILRFAMKDDSKELKSVIDTTKSPRKVANWMDKNNISYLIDEITRSTSAMPAEMSAALKSKKVGDIFLVNENEDRLLVAIDAVEETPISMDKAKARIEMHLLNKKRREAAEAAIAHLRSLAEIEYFHETTDITEQATSQPAIQLTNETDNSPQDDTLQAESIERGLSGLK